MKKVKLILSIFMLALLTFGLVSCGGFIAEESVVITDIKITPKDDGTGSNITIITLVNGEYEEEHKFFVANGDKGDTGESGNGIAGITYAPSADKKSTICTITFTDEEIEPKQIEIPNGSSIASVYTSPDDETGGTVVNFVLENGTELAPILVPKGNDGKDGKDGVGIKEIIDEPQEDKSVKLTIVFDDEEGTTKEIFIPAPEKGEAGRGIKNIMAGTENGFYVFRITYTDDTEQVINLERPKDWYSGNTTPNPNLGQNGDYYFNTISKTIYNKVDNRWLPIVEFKSDDKYYTVTFELNGGSLPAGYGYELIYGIKSGTTFSDVSERVPLPIRDGYTFGGWYTVQTPTIVNGMFTDMTPVNSNIILYAYWIPNTNE